jgi:dTDP-glucose 4,6-dehydratase
MNYAANKKNVEKKFNFETKKIENTETENNYFFYQRDVSDFDFMFSVLNKHNVDVVFHFASQSHVDLSFLDPLLFVEENILSTTSFVDCNKKFK